MLPLVGLGTDQVAKAVEGSGVFPLLVAQGFLNLGPFKDPRDATGPC